MKDKRILIGTALVLLLLLTTGLSYAYFSTAVKGNDNAKDVVVEAGTLKLTYTDGPTINVQNVKPGWTTTKTVSVKNNGTLDTAYNIVWQELTNTILKNELVISATCKKLNASGTVEGTCEPITELPARAKRIAKNISIESGFTHEYTFTFLFKETNTSQNYNQGKEFSGVLGIEEYKDNSPKPIYCTFDGELTQGVEYTNGQYTYKYMQKKVGFYDTEFEKWNSVWQNSNIDGWGVELTNTTSSTDAVTTTLCTYINNKPIVSTNYMFFKSRAKVIDLSGFDTSNVTSMSGMFYGSSAITINGLENFDTSKVTDMSYMFYGSSAITINGLENFDTSKVTDMSYMFSNSAATTLDVSAFDTSNVINMSSMFGYSKATILDVSNFDTSNVTNMSQMFYFSNATTLDVSTFDTSNVTDMSSMFSNSKATTLDVSAFDTSNVTNMSSIFYYSAVTTLDVSTFNTSNVTNMSYMFGYSKATTLDVSNFDTSNVTDMSGMFYFSKATTLDVSSFDTSNVTNMWRMFENSINLKTIYASNKFNTDKVTTDVEMFSECTNLVGGAETKYNSSYTDKTYAHIDGGTSNPGYFTDIADKK